MQERFAIRSGLVVLILAALCSPTQQRPPCPSSADCGENALGMGEHHHYGPNTRLISRIENLAAVKELMEKLLMQHNAFADDNVSEAEEGSSSSEKPSSLAPMSASIEVEDSTDRPLSSSALEEEDITTERPPIQIVSDDQLKLAVESGHSSEHSSTTKNTNDEDTFLELTMVEPQRDYPHEVTKVQPPKSIIVDKSGDQVAVPTQAPVSSTQKKNTTPYPINLPPSRPSNRNKTKRTTTQRPHVIVHPQKLNTPNLTPFSENPEKIKGPPTAKPGISTLMAVDRDHDVKDEIQLETLNRPIIRRKPTATPVGSATSNRPKKKPINITPQSVVVKKGPPKPVGKPQGSPGIRNPIRNSSAPPREPEDYIISALASIADGGDENTDGDDDDGDEDDEDDEYEEENSNENEVEEEDEDEDEYLYNSEEEIEER